ncbi:MAG: chorismate synthase [Clostridia bacterium]|nr:chorismate synthase [Clostridia bacterium]
MSCSFGENIKLTVFGQSHSQSIGCVIDGLPAGEKISMEKLRSFMNRRAPGQNELSTPRKEQDEVQFISGILDSRTVGAPVCAVINNTNTKSQDYDKLKLFPRPGHADYTAFVKHGGMNDARGGGNFSGRMTAPLCAAGGILLQLLEKKGVNIGAHIYSIGDVYDEKINPVSGSILKLKDAENKSFPVISDSSGEEMRAKILEAKSKGDSVGGIIECVITGVPAGTGDPIFDGLENKIAAAIFAIPAVKGIEFGAGFGASFLKGSENNDSFVKDGETIKTVTNNHGGILGGIASGMPVVFRVAVKPTPSIMKEQNTLNLKSGEQEKLVVGGRHDPCIVPRAVPVVQAAAALAVSDFLLK